MPVHARQDGPIRTTNKRKMAGVAKPPSHTSRGVPDVGEAARHHRRQWTGGVTRMVWSRPSARLIRWIFFRMTTPARACQEITLLFLHTHLVTNEFHSDVDAVRSAIDALLADVEHVVVMTPLDHLDWALALPLCMGISRPPEMLRRAVHQKSCFRASWFGSVSPKDSCFMV